MGWFLNMWATVYRNTRALMAAVVIWAAVALMWGLKCQQERDPIVGVGEEKGTVVRLLGSDPAQENNPGLKMRPVQIMLADSTMIELVISTPLPAVGDRVPLRFEKFESGKRSYYFNLQKWQISGPE